MTVRAWGDEYRTTTVCVDSYENCILSGRFYNSYLESGKEFESLTQFLLYMEQSLDSMDFPKAFTTTRTFAPLPSLTSASINIEEKLGKLATFKIKVLFRQSASWQGSITWLEGKMEQSFRSALEMIFLIDSALKSADNPSEQ